jgi:hypothetical protein
MPAVLGPGDTILPSWWFRDGFDGRANPGEAVPLAVPHRRTSPGVGAISRHRAFAALERDEPTVGQLGSSPTAAAADLR